jgi:hypothetical protein
MSQGHVMYAHSTEFSPFTQYHHIVKKTPPRQAPQPDKPATLNLQAVKNECRNHRSNEESKGGDPKVQNGHRKKTEKFLLTQSDMTLLTLKFYQMDQDRRTE